MGKSRLINVDDLSFRYRDDSPWTLKNISLEVYKGEWLSIIGHNGSGKSTLAKSLNGLLQPGQGEVEVRGYKTTDEEGIWEIRQIIGMVFQNPDNQFVGTTVMDDIVFGMENRGFPRDVMERRLVEVLEQVKMNSYQYQEPHRLSGGQKQRIAIAGALATQPDVMVLDEATSMLDPAGRNDVVETVAKLNRDNDMTVIAITHDLEETLRADRIIVMNDGEIAMEGSPAEIYQEPHQLEALGLDLPFSIKMKEELRQRGINVPSDVLLSEELVKAIWT